MGSHPSPHFLSVFCQYAIGLTPPIHPFADVILVRSLRGDPRITCSKIADFRDFLVCLSPSVSVIQFSAGASLGEQGGHRGIDIMATSRLGMGRASATGETTSREGSRTTRTRPRTRVPSGLRTCTATATTGRGRSARQAGRRHGNNNLMRCGASSTPSPQR